MNRISAKSEGINTRNIQKGKLFRLLFIGFFINLSFCALTFGQAKVKVLLRQCNVENKLIKLNLASKEKENVIVVWQLENGKQAYESLDLCPGWNIVDLSLNRNWKGRVVAIGTTNTNVSAQLIESNFLNRMSSFLQPQFLSPKSINFVKPVSLFGYRFSTGLYCIIILTTIVCKFFRINWRKSLYFGLITAVSVLCIRNTVNEIAIINRFEQESQKLQPFRDIQIFADQVETVLQSKTWSKDDLGGIYNSYVKYRFAEHKHVKDTETVQNDYFITYNPGNKRILFNYKRFYLVQK